MEKVPQGMWGPLSPKKSVFEKVDLDNISAGRQYEVTFKEPQDVNGQSLRTCVLTAFQFPNGEILLGVAGEVEYPEPAWGLDQFEEIYEWQ